MRGLYVIADVCTLTARGLDVIGFARAALEARPAALQIRAKELPSREFFTLLRSVAPLCRDAGVPLVANDRVDLAALAGCDYVHLGQGHFPIELVRRIAPGLRVGISTHNLDQLDRALAARPTYVAYGPVFPTASKANPDPCVGLGGLRAAAAKASAAGIPLVAIGGISLERAHDVAGIADAAAVIAALLPTEVPSEGRTSAYALAQVAHRARQLRDLLRRGSTEALDLAAERPAIEAHA